MYCPVLVPYQYRQNVGTPKSNFLGSSLRVENLSGTLVAKKTDTEEKPDSQAIQEQLGSSFGFPEEIAHSDEQHSLVNNAAIPASKAKCSTLKSASISRKAFSVQDKVL
ncbi:hypothetical protein BHE74_00037670 [Ensete ventricosum]|nr:hypothetical protein BHE74_00037670 [Ensete ventricosum]RZS19892.1 hypothetical protein BHM03_00052349 [Ensete ventricosum]